MNQSTLQKAARFGLIAAFALVGKTVIAQTVISVPINQPAPLQATGSDVTVCVDDGPVQLTTSTTGGTSPYTYMWAPATGLSSTTIANPTSDPTTTTNYTVTVTDANGCTFSDIVTVTVNPCTGIHDPVGGMFVSLFPNPTNGKASLELEDVSNREVMVEITDIAGRVIYTTTVTGNSQTQIDLTGQATGVYFLRLTGENLNYRRKLVVE